MHNRRRVISGPNVVLPNHIGNVAAWYRYGQGITQAGGFASAWADQSGNGRDLLQGTGAAQPAVNPDGSLLFNGTSHTMRALFTLPQPATVCVLANPITWTLQDRLWNSAGFSAGPRVAQTNLTPQLQYFCTTGVAVISASLGAYHTFVAVANDTSSVLRIDSTEQTGASGTTALDGITLCAAAAGGANFGNFEVKEMIVFPFALDAQQRLLMQRYLASVGNLVI